MLSHVAGGLSVTIAEFCSSFEQQYRVRSRSMVRCAIRPTSSQPPSRRRAVTIAADPTRRRRIYGRRLAVTNRRDGNGRGFPEAPGLRPDGDGRQVNCLPVTAIKFSTLFRMIAVPVVALLGTARAARADSSTFASSDVLGVCGAKSTRQALIALLPSEPSPSTDERCLCVARFS